MSRRPAGDRPDRPPDDRPAPPLPPGGGLLLVDKPTGCTSHDVVGRLRHVLRTRRIGHAGTLDPMATGLLVLAVDRSTRLLGHLALTDKTYLATIRLGQQTDTDDADGSVVGSPASVRAVTDDDIRAGVSALTGPLLQVPSSVSAIKVDGRRAYDLVRSGVTVDLAARPVTVSRFEILGAPRRLVVPAGPSAGEHLDAGPSAGDPWPGSGSVGDARVGELPVIDLDVAIDCTTGTYVRSLARDLGFALGVGGHLTRLRRTRVGPFDVDAAVDVFGTASAAETALVGSDPRSSSAVGSVAGDAGGVHPQTPRPGVPRPPVTAEFAASIAQAIIPAAQAVTLTFPSRVVGEKEADDLRHGRTIEAIGLPGVYAVVDRSGDFIALAAESAGAARSVLGWQVNG